MAVTNCWPVSGEAQRWRIMDFSCDERKGFLELFLSFPIIGGSKLRFFGMDLPIPEYIDMTNLAP